MQKAAKKSPLGMIVGIVVLVALGLFAFRACMPSALPASGIPETGDTIPNAQEGLLGQPFVAQSVDSAGCPLGVTGQFSPNESIFAGFERSDIPSGTSIFARLSQDGRALEDTDEITADRDIRSCVWFEFQPTDSRGFEPGSYTVDFFINGNPAEQVAFEVGGGTGFGQGGLAAIDLGRVTTTSGVDSQGCPIDREDRFRPDDEVYVAYDSSLIPAGTQMYARLVYDGQVIEETQAITADQDLESCVWFVFENFRGLDPGSYEAEVVINGSLADRLDFQVD